MSLLDRIQSYAGEYVPRELQRTVESYVRSYLDESMPRRPGMAGAMSAGGALLLGAVLGAAAMYFFDPEVGGRRRTLVRDQAVSFSTTARDTMDAKSRHMMSRARGLRHRIGLAAQPREEREDETRR